MKTITFQIVGMHCTSCAINIDFELEDIEGVQEARTHYAKQVSVVTFDPSKVKEQNMISAIKQLGYDVVITTGI